MHLDLGQPAAARDVLRKASPAAEPASAPPGSQHAPASPGSQHAPATPGSQHTPAPPGSQHAPAPPGSQHAPAPPGSQHASALPGSQHAFGWDWRVEWYLGLAALLEQDFEQAFAHFDAVLQALPGEIAPKLALAATAELVLQHWDSPDPEQWRAYAEKFYATVWRTDRGVVSAAFGLARQLAAAGRITEAVRALDEVPAASRHYCEARMTAVLLLLTAVPVADLEESTLHIAAARVQSLPPGEHRVPQMRALVLGAALAWLQAGRTPKLPDATLFDDPFTERDLRHGAESTLRTLARSAPGRTHRYALVDLANSIRAKTWF
ncbi:hypothetical protein IU452_11305 [Nocardia transvalensis]|nr:hypothetical protein [Nocardia transvalensis]